MLFRPFVCFRTKWTRLCCMDLWHNLQYDLKTSAFVFHNSNMHSFQTKNQHHILALCVVLLLMIFWFWGPHSYKALYLFGLPLITYLFSNASILFYLPTDKGLFKYQVIGRRGRGVQPKDQFWSYIQSSSFYSGAKIK